ncbi:MAG: exodeoxyribonuclease VII large subunit [bacterium TMED88]|nr:exodeoxyribonuclease VII large subunit [Deltaproteobacteria bacterium]OUV31759.1 MAG: exodeoxyribonuclease VII large subunit [bacterium TMED88]
MSGPGDSSAVNSPERSTAPGRRVFSVSELAGGLNALLEDRVGRVWVAGEVSGLSQPRSGHVYFTLKDGRSQLDAAFFRQAASRIPFRLEDGLEVLVYADVQIYTGRGRLQLIVKKVEPQGRGALQLAFEQLKSRLAGEGLFDPARKQEIPRFPNRIAIVTSSAGAALRDVIEVSGQRSPATPLLLVPTRVQGEGAEDEIAIALRMAGEVADVDLVLLVRGGGSFEDLWCFNTEQVARAIAECPVPVIAGVGHETDVTIADWVADARAPTPSAAAMQALPDRQAWSAALEHGWQRLVKAVESRHVDLVQRLAHERDALVQASPRARMATQRMRCQAAYSRLRLAVDRDAERRRNRWSGLSAQLDSLSPLSVLGRGYALARRVRDDRIVRAPVDAPRGEALMIRLAEGRIQVTVEDHDPEAG